MSKANSTPDNVANVEEQLRRKSYEKLLEFLNDDPEQRDMELGRIALKTAVMVNKREATQLHREVLAFSIIQAIHREPEALAKSAASFRPDLKKLPA
ncbi:MAG: hypothetical protein JXM79_00380 [Sedimentisphaerales bacterium]|nr:hypothetical protein [Sedimentisphaerales bacterium]